MTARDISRLLKRGGSIWTLQTVLGEQKLAGNLTTAVFETITATDLDTTSNLKQSQPGNSRPHFSNLNTSLDI